MERFLLLDLERTGDAAVFADSPKVDRQEYDEDEGKHQDVQYIPSQQRFRADLLASQENKSDLVSKYGGKAHHVGAYGHRPKG